MSNFGDTAQSAPASFWAEHQEEVAQTLGRVRIEILGPSWSVLQPCLTLHARDQYPVVPQESIGLHRQANLFITVYPEQNGESFRVLARNEGWSKILRNVDPSRLEEELKKVIQWLLEQKV